MRIDASDEDTYIGELIKAARVYCEQATRRAFITQTITYVEDSFPASGDSIALPVPNLIAVTSLKYYDADGAQQTWASSNYTANSYAFPPQVDLTYGISYPSVRSQYNAVEVTYTAGYGAASAVPDSIKHAIKLLVAHWHENRESVVMQGTPKEVPKTVDALLAPYIFIEAV